MIPHSLCLILKEQEKIPDFLESLSPSFLERKPNYSKLSLFLSREQESHLRSVLSSKKLDFFLLAADKEMPTIRLAVLDMDSTLIQNEVIDEMALLFGKGKEVKEITERAMNGELNFDGALKERVALLKGLGEDHLQDVLKVLRVTSGVPELIRKFKRKGIKTAVVSGGFQFFAGHFKDLLGLDYAFANGLEFQEGRLTGQLLGEIVNGERKAALLRELAEKENFPLEGTLSIGDGANDIPMLKAAGLGIAYHAKEKVKQEILHQVNFGDMETIGYYLGLE